MGLSDLGIGHASETKLTQRSKRSLPAVVGTCIPIPTPVKPPL